MELLPLGVALAQAPRERRPPSGRPDRRPPGGMRERRRGLAQIVGLAFRSGRVRLLPNRNFPILWPYQTRVSRPAFGKGPGRQPAKPSQGSAGASPSQRLAGPASPSQWHAGGVALPVARRWRRPPGAMRERRHGMAQIAGLAFSSGRVRLLPNRNFPILWPYQTRVSRPAFGKRPGRQPAKPSQGSAGASPSQWHAGPSPSQWHAGTSPSRCHAGAPPWDGADCWSSLPQREGEAPAEPELPNPLAISNPR